MENQLYIEPQRGKNEGVFSPYGMPYRFGFYYNKGLNVPEGGATAEKIYYGMHFGNINSDATFKMVGCWIAKSLFDDGIVKVYQYSSGPIVVFSEDNVVGWATREESTLWGGSAPQTYVFNSAPSNSNRTTFLEEGNIEERALIYTFKLDTTRNAIDYVEKHESPAYPWFTTFPNEYCLIKNGASYSVGLPSTFTINDLRPTIVNQDWEEGEEGEENGLKWDDDFGFLGDDSEAMMEITVKGTATDNRTGAEAEAVTAAGETVAGDAQAAAVSAAATQAAEPEATYNSIQTAARNAAVAVVVAASGDQEAQDACATASDAMVAQNYVSEMVRDGSFVSYSPTNPFYQQGAISDVLSINSILDGKNCLVYAEITLGENSDEEEGTINRNFEVEIKHTIDENPMLPADETGSVLLKLCEISCRQERYSLFAHHHYGCDIGGGQLIYTRMEIPDGDEYNIALRWNNIQSEWQAAPPLDDSNVDEGSFSSGENVIVGAIKGSTGLIQLVEKRLDLFDLTAGDEDNIAFRWNDMICEWQAAPPLNDVNLNEGAFLNGEKVIVGAIKGNTGLIQLVEKTLTFPDSLDLTTGDEYNIALRWNDIQSEWQAAPPLDDSNVDEGSFSSGEKVIVGAIKGSTGLVQLVEKNLTFPDSLDLTANSITFQGGKIEYDGSEHKLYQYDVKVAITANGTLSYTSYDSTNYTSDGGGHRHEITTSVSHATQHPE